MGELLVSKKGLGYLIMYGTQVFNIDLVIASVIVLGILAFLFYYLICLFEKYIQKKTVNWKVSSFLSNKLHVNLYYPIILSL